MNKNQRIIKFVRKELQSSESIVPKKESREKVQEEERIRQEVGNREEQKLREFLAYYQPGSPEQSKKKVIKNAASQISEGHERENVGSKADTSKDNTESVNFDKKLLKMSMPEEAERAKFVKKLQNKLCSCLERKKPQIQMKKLVKVELLGSILDKKQRVVVSRVPNYNEHLENEAHSLRKGEEKISDRRSKQKSRLVEHKNNDRNGYLKSMPLKIPLLSNEAQNRQFNFEGHFNFQQDNQTDSTFVNMGLDNELPSNCNNFFGNEQSNHNSQFPFQQYHEDNSHSYHPFSNQLPQNQRINNRPNSESMYQSRPPDRPYQQKYQSETYIDIKKIKIPKIQQPRPEARKSGMFYQMLPVVEEQGSKFYSPEKAHNPSHEGYSRAYQDRTGSYWQQTGSSESKYSHQSSNLFY